uniref:Twitchin n=1 Tax=Romanomermis culicivorax TaxID=13658 RepID=A0A915KJU8_ROMCU
MTLEWQPPDDDGGVPVEYYEVEKMDESTGRWVPCGRVTGTNYVAQNLQAGHQYQFRVKAVNKEGESDPLTTERGALAKNPYDRPDKTSKPEIVDWDQHHVDLKWEKPIDEHGAPVEQYIIEKKDKHGKWHKAAEVPGNQTTAAVANLTEGEEYQFRVIAVNKGGESDPSDPSSSTHNRDFTCRSFFNLYIQARMAPKINRNDLPDTTVKVGQPIKFNVNITGEPPPDIQWEFDGKPLTKTANLTIDNPDYLSKFLISKAARNQSGVYKIIATNSSGTDAVEVTVNVLSKPANPEGPLETKDVFEDHITLEWKPPLDDGGTPIDHYDIEKLDTSTNQWVPAGRSKDTGFTVANLQKGHTYKFRVKAVNSEGPSDPLETEQGILAKNPYDKPTKPGKPTLDDWDKDHVDLHWVPPENDNGAEIEKYIVEKRTKYGRWEPGIEVPGSQLKATVPNLTEKEEYEFRVVAVNKGGPSDPSDPSDKVIAKARNCKYVLNFLFLIIMKKHKLCLYSGA